MERVIFPPGHPCHCKASMGPPPFGDGKLCQAVTASWASSALQWGHRLSAMESRQRRAHRGRLADASMGPPPFGDGKDRGVPGLGVGVQASMGPPPFGDGKGLTPFSVHPVCHMLQWGHRLSAMESRSATPASQSRWPCFNGATAFRRWKGILIKGNAAAPVVLQWGHRLSAMERRAARRGRPTTSTSFNGATAFRRWKVGSVGVIHVEVRLASMGPPPFGDGKTRSGKPGSDLRLSLQWGHRLSAMESSGVGAAEHLSRPASMGPPPFGDGKGNMTSVA